MLYFGLAVLMFVLPIPQFFGPDDVKAIGVQTTILNLFLLFFGGICVIELVNKRIDFRACSLAKGCVLGLVLVGIISVCVSKDKLTAIYGTELRGEGLISLVTYYMIFYVTTMLKNQQYRQRLLYLFLLCGSLICIIGMIQFTGIYEFGDMFPGMACVPMRNPNFYGGFSVLFTGVAIGGFYLFRNGSTVTNPCKQMNRNAWYLLVLLGYGACISSDSSLVYVGIIMMLLLYLFLLLITHRADFFGYLSLVLGIVFLVFLFDFIRGGRVIDQILSVSHQIDEGGSVFADGVGSGRMLGWKNILKLLPDYWLLGCGIEQLGPLYIDRYHPPGQYFDKAHNEYLNLWITEGIFAIVLYLMFLFVLFFPGVLHFYKESKKKDEIRMIVLFAFFGYIAQAFFSISVVQVAPYFWLICGLLYSESKMGG